MTGAGASGRAVRVAPRELVDLAYRCGRVAGLDAGSADRAARNVTAAEVGYGGALGAFLDAMDDPERLAAAFRSAPDALAAAEVEARHSGSAEARLPGPTPVAALALAIDEVRGRGLDVSGIPDGADATTTVEVLEVGGAPQARAIDAATHVAVARDGLEVDAVAFGGLTDRAHAFLVAEAVLDAADA